MSNRSLPSAPIYFNNEIPIVVGHKHLGVTLSNDAKWGNHIQAINSTSSKYMYRSTFRKL